MIQSFNDSINSFKDKYSKVNIDFKAKRAEADVAKYLVEKEKATKSYDENSEITLEYYELKRQEDILKKQKENLEISITSFESRHKMVVISFLYIGVGQGVYCLINRFEKISY